MVTKNYYNSFIYGLPFVGAIGTCATVMPSTSTKSQAITLTVTYWDPDATISYLTSTCNNVSSKKKLCLVSIFQNCYIMHT